MVGDFGLEFGVLLFGYGCVFCGECVFVECFDLLVDVDLCDFEFGFEFGE